MAADLTWDDTHRLVRPLLRADNRTNVGYIALEYALLVAFLAAGGWLVAAWQAGQIPTPAAVPLALVVQLGVAAVQHRFSGLGHEASHYSLFRNRWANELASDFLLMFPLLATTQHFRATHLDHHRYVTDPVRDPDAVRLQRPWPVRWPMPQWRFWLRFVLGAAWPPYLLGYLYGQAKNANAIGTTPLRNVYGPITARIMRFGYVVALFAVVAATGVWVPFLVFWVMPLLTFYPFLMQLREIAHHSNAPDDGDLTNSRVFQVHPLLSACVFPYGQAFHVTHHLFGMLPHYRMPAAHAILMRHPPYRERVVVCRGYFWRTPGTEGPTVVEVLARA